MVNFDNADSFTKIPSHPSCSHTERNRASSAARLFRCLLTWFRLPSYTKRRPVTIREINNSLNGKGKQRLKVTWNKEPEEWQKE